VPRDWLAALQPKRIDAMVVVSATMYFPTQAREIMRRVLTAETQPPQEWESMRQRHKLGDQQIVALWDWTRGMEHSDDDMNFTPAALSRIVARTLIVYGDRDPLYPVEMALEMYRAIPRSALWVLPNSGHGPVFLGAATQFAQTSLAFLKNP
jgi:pimeloyl-ACP methyl ester carboxylesterase